jgi:GT2 family glycosyltransferase
MSAKPLVSVVIVNRNGAEHLRICLPTLRAQSYEPIEIIVVDNASSDASAEVTENAGAQWLRLPSNIGLAPALNRGAAAATGELLLFVNNDMRFDPDFVAVLSEVLLKDKSIFAVDGMQFDWEGNRPGHQATRLAKRGRCSGSAIQIVPGLYLYQECAAKNTPVLMASAACMLVRKHIFDSIGRFDERLPLSYEDVEICWRAWIGGWKTVYAPGAICWHRVGSSCRSAEGSRLLFKGILKGRLLLATKALPLRYALWTWLLSTAGVAKDLARLQWQTARDRLAVLLQYAGYIPQLLREKSALFRAAGVTPEQHLESMLRISYGDQERTQDYGYKVEDQWKRAG